jgi:medium-chain acyl-[acyl-carrier-protein] hydrolase
LLDPVDDIDVLMRRTRVLLVPSLWAEARSRIVLEAMHRAVPVMAANVGGIPEAKMGVPYMLPVNPIARYRTDVDEQMVPVAEVPPQNIQPWREALHRLLCDEAHYREISQQSRDAAVRYASTLTAEPFEQVLEGLLERPQAMRPDRPASAPNSLSPEKRKLLALRLRQKAPAASFFPGADRMQGLRLFCFPHSGGGAAPYVAWREPHVCPVRLPGRESRLAEKPFDRMEPLVGALASAIAPYLSTEYAFFGHSMGAAIAFELARELRRRGKPLPRILIASGARAPQFRRNWVPPPAPSQTEFIEELRSLEGMPKEILDDPAALRAMLPAIEADAALYRNYIYADEPPLDIPIRAYGGDGDPRINREDLEPWRDQTTKSFAVRMFPGGHFYLNDPALLKAALREDVQ